MHIYSRGFTSPLILVAVFVGLIAIGGVGYVALQKSAGNASSTTVTNDPHLYESTIGYSIRIPPNTSIDEKPASENYSALTNFKGEWGLLCISPGYGCGGKGLQGWGSEGEKLIRTSDNRMIKLKVAFMDDQRTLFLESAPDPLPTWWTKQGQIQIETTKEYLETVEVMLESLTF